MIVPPVVTVLAAMQAPQKHQWVESLRLQGDLEVSPQERAIVCQAHHRVIVPYEFFPL